MKKITLAVMTAAALSSFSVPVYALDKPASGRADSRIQHTIFKDNDVVLIKAAIGRATHIVLSADEKVQEIVSGNSEAWEIADRRNNIYLKPKMNNADTNLLLTTNKHEYSLELRVVPTDKAPTYRLVFKYPQEEGNRTRAALEKGFVESNLQEIPSIYAQNINANYTMQQGANSDSFKPLAAFDDGTLTYVKFPRGKDMPNIFRVLDNKEEAIINSTVQDDFLILEGVYQTMMIRANNAVIGLYNEKYTDGGKGTGTNTASPVVERVIIKGKE